MDKKNSSKMSARLVIDPKKFRVFVFQKVVPGVSITTNAIGAEGFENLKNILEKEFGSLVSTAQVNLIARHLASLPNLFINNRTKNKTIINKYMRELSMAASTLSNLLHDDFGLITLEHLFPKIDREVEENLWAYLSELSLADQETYDSLYFKLSSEEKVSKTNKRSESDAFNSFIVRRVAIAIKSMNYSKSINTLVKKLSEVITNSQVSLEFVRVTSKQVGSKIKRNKK